MMRAFGVSHINHVNNIEASTRHFPIGRIDTVIELYEEQHNRDYIRFCAHVSRPRFQFPASQVPTIIHILLALHFSGLLTPEKQQELMQFIESEIPDMPEEYKEKLIESSRYGTKRK